MKLMSSKHKFSIEIFNSLYSMDEIIMTDVLLFIKTEELLNPI